MDNCFALSFILVTVTKPTSNKGETGRGNSSKIAASNRGE